jgi:hypothetical protein
VNPKLIQSLNAHKKLGFKLINRINNAYGNAEGLEKGQRLLMKLKK